MQVVRKEYELNGLNCAHCAAKIEEGIQAIPEIMKGNLNFVLKTLTIEFEESADTKALKAKIQEIIYRHEPHIQLIEKSDNASIKSKIDRTKIISHFSLKQILIFGLGIVLFLSAVLFRFDFWTELSLFFLSYVLIGGKVLQKAIRNIGSGQVFDENFLMAIATLGAFAIQEFPEAVAVMLFYRVGEFFQDGAVNRSRKSIRELMDIRPDYANLIEGEQEIRVSPEEIKQGQIIRIKPGEKVPLDSIVVSGTSILDTSALTGESMPKEVKAGSQILSGCINLTGVLTVEVVKEYAESTVSRILDLVENASSKKAQTENFITKFARYYTPAVVLGAALLAFLPPLFLPEASLSEWVHRALVFLVVSCPCALVISIPLSFFGGIGSASRKGILIKGGNYLEGLNQVKTMVFDKTGTLTEGVFEVAAVYPIEGESEESVLKAAAWAESYSSHPIAISILKSYGRELDKSQIQEAKETPGHGVKIIIDGKEIIAGSAKMMDKENIPFVKIKQLGTVVYVAVDRNVIGTILITDQIRKDATEALKRLRTLGINKMVMLTGDIKSVGENIGAKLGMDKVYTELLPDQKVEILEKLEKEIGKGEQLAFVGDGINDAPVLARAGIGIAMGGLGSDAAIEAADIVLMTDEPSKIALAVEIANRTRVIVWQNIIFALGIKGLILILGAIGIATMWEAVFADVGVALIAILNAMRLLNTR